MAAARVIHRPQPAAGFTLIEILVVLVIIGVVLTFATLSLDPSGPADRLNTQAERLLALTQAAADESVLSGHTIGLQLTRDGYDFVGLDDSGWHALSEDDSGLQPRQLGESIHLERLSVGDTGEDSRQARRQNAILTLPPSPVEPTPAEAKKQAEQRAAARKRGNPPIPAALFLSSGELLPFRLELSADGVDHRFDITGTANGDITLQRIER